MRLSVWNPLGGKEVHVLAVLHAIGAQWRVGSRGRPDVERLAGCAPWIKSNEVTIYNVYPGGGFSQRYQPNIAKQYDAMIVDDINESGRWKAFWVPGGRGTGR